MAARPPRRARARAAKSSLVEALGLDRARLDEEAAALLRAAGRTAPAAAADADPRQISALVERMRHEAALRAVFNPDDILPEAEPGARLRALGSFLSDCERVPGGHGYLLRTELRVRALREFVVAGRLQETLERIPAPSADDTLGFLYRQVLKKVPISIAGKSAFELSCLERIAEWTSDVLPNALDGAAIRAERIRNGFLGELQPLLARGFYGRRDELKTLHAFYDRAPSSACEVAIVSGFGGSGKSTLLARFLVRLRRRQLPLIAWLDFDRPNLDPLVPHLLAFEVARQLGVQRPELANHLHNLRVTLRNEGRSTEVLRSAGESAFEQSQKAAYEVSTTLASLLRAAGRPLILILDSFEQATQRREDAIRAVGSWVNGLSEALRQNGIVLKVVMSGRLYGHHLEQVRASLSSDPVELGELAPLNETAARQMLVREGVEESLAALVVQRVSRQPLILQIFAQAERDHPGFAQDFTRNTEGLDGRQRDEAYRDMVFRRFLARVREPIVQILIDPGLALRRITTGAVTGVLAAALQEIMITIEAALVKACDARFGLASSGTATRPEAALVQLSALGDAELDALRSHAEAGSAFRQAELLIGCDGVEALKRYKVLRDKALALGRLDESQVVQAYEALVDYAWLVAQRSNGAWFIRDVRRLMLHLVTVRAPGVIRAIHEAAVRHYENRTPADDQADAMYHRLMLADTPEKCDAIDREALRSLAPVIKEEADDFPPAAAAFFGYHDSGAVEAGKLAMLPARDQLEAFPKVGDRLVRQGQYEEVRPLVRARPASAPLKAWEIQARYALLDWDRLASPEEALLDPSAGARERHFAMHYTAFARFLRGDLAGAAADFDRVVAYARTMFTSQTDSYLVVRSLLYRLVVAHAAGKLVQDSTLTDAVLRSVVPADLGAASDAGGTDETLERSRLALLLSRPALRTPIRECPFTLGVSQFPLDIEWVEIDTRSLHGWTVRDDDVQDRWDRTRTALAEKVHAAGTVRDLLRRVDTLRRRPDLMWGVTFSLADGSSDDMAVKRLLRGPDPEFRDPLRSVLAQAFPQDSDREELAAIVLELYPHRLKDLQPSAFAKAMRLSSRDTLVTLVEFIDRARLMPAFVRRVQAVRPTVPEVEVLARGYGLWCRAFDAAQGISQGPNEGSR